MDEVLKIALEETLPELKEETPEVLEPGVLNPVAARRSRGRTSKAKVQGAEGQVRDRACLCFWALQGGVYAWTRCSR